MQIYTNHYFFCGYRTKSVDIRGVELSNLLGSTPFKVLLKDFEDGQKVLMKTLKSLAITASNRVQSF